MKTISSLSKTALIAIAVLASLTLTQCDNQSTQPPETKLPELTPTEQQLTEADNLFGLELFRTLSAEDPNENIFISPLSIATALAMAANGAEGNTKTEIYQTLGFSSLNQEEINQSFKQLIAYHTQFDPDVTIEIANSIWSNKNYQIKPSFIQTNQTYYDARVEALDFSDEEAADIINNWVKEQTHDLIDGIVEKPLDPELIMFLLNAIYFKGDWTYQFEDTNTHASQFYADDGPSTSIELMNGRFAYNYLFDSYLQAVELPYGTLGYNMLVLLPGHDVDINDFIEGLNAQSLEGWLEAMSEDTITLSLPKFTLEYEKTLNEILKLMGIREAFNPSLADFSGIRSERDLMISNVKHKAFVKVNEAGTEAAAVTSIEFGPTSIDPYLMIVNRPFVFIIRENNSGTILFMGKVTELGS